jgi:hypothetical protein
MRAAVGSVLLALTICAEGVSLRMAQPVQKVIQLMENMLEKGKAEKQAEQVQYTAHKQFCDDTTLEKNRAIADALQTSSTLKVDVRKYTADAAVLSRDIALLDEDIATWAGDMKAATNVRTVEKTDRAATIRSYTETSDALSIAAAFLKQAAYDRKHNEVPLATAVTNLNEIKIAHESKQKIEAAGPLPHAMAVLRKAEHDRKQNNPVLRAVVVVKKAEKDRKQQEASWAQLMKKLIPDAARKAVDNFLQQSVVVSGPGVSEFVAEDLGTIWHRLVRHGEHDNEFQCHDVIELLYKLSDKFVDERVTLEREEKNAEQNYAMVMEDLKAQIAQAAADRAQKVETKAKKLQAKADAVADLEDATNTMHEDQKYLSDLTTTCAQTASAFKVREQLRSDELVAIVNAIDIISGSAVAGNAEKHFAGVSRKASSFVQLSSTSSGHDHAVKYLEAQAEKLHSRVLASIASHVSRDPPARVTKMIKDLILRLGAEASEEAAHQGWCDTELASNAQTRKKKTDQVETLRADIDRLQASVSKITEHITDFTQAITDIDAAIAEATKLRAPDKAANAETISDAHEAQDAVSQALTILREHYAKVAKSAALVQQPELFGSSYKGMQPESTGVLGMLEVIKSDFARLESETKEAEASAQKDFDEFMADSKLDKAQKSHDIEHNIAKRKEESLMLAQKVHLLEHTQHELDIAFAYFDKLKPSCNEFGVSYEDRADRRRGEVESLQEALRIFNEGGLAEVPKNPRDELHSL